MGGGRIAETQGRQAMLLRHSFVSNGMILTHVHSKVHKCAVPSDYYLRSQISISRTCSIPNIKAKNQ